MQPQKGKSECPKHAHLNSPRHSIQIVHNTIYTVEYYSAIKMNEIMPFAATWTDLEIIILSEVSQKEEDKYHMISLMCGI